MSDYSQEVVTPTSTVHMAATTLTICYHDMTILLHPVTIGYSRVTSNLCCSIRSITHTQLTHTYICHIWGHNKVTRATPISMALIGVTIR